MEMICSVAAAWADCLLLLANRDFDWKGEEGRKDGGMIGGRERRMEGRKQANLERMSLSSFHSSLSSCLLHCVFSRSSSWVFYQHLDHYKTTDKPKFLKIQRWPEGYILVQNVQ